MPTMKELPYIRYNSFKGFFQEFYNYRVSQPPLDELIFRGEACATYQLYPWALRTSSRKLLNLLADPTGAKPTDNCGDRMLDIECRAVYNFYRLANYRGLPVPGIDTLVMDTIDAEEMINEVRQLGVIPKKYYELFALAQHYRVPTRFLDWSKDIHIALWFAATTAFKNFHRHMPQDCTPANGGVVPNAMKGKNCFKLWILNYRKIQELKNVYKTGKNNTQPLEFVIPPYANNPNLQAQKGILSYVPIPFDEKKEIKNGYIGESVYNVIKDITKGDTDNYIREFFFKWEEAPEVMNLLELHGYNSSTIFPGYSSLVDSIIQKNKIKNNYIFN